MGASGADMLSSPWLGWPGQDGNKARLGDRCVPAIPSGRQTYKRGYTQCSLAISPEGQRPQPAQLLIAATRIPPSQAINSSDVPKGVVRRRAPPHLGNVSTSAQHHLGTPKSKYQHSSGWLAGNKVFPRGDRPGPAGWGSVCKDHQFPITLLFAL